MEQLVRVQKLNPDGTAQVLHIRKSACSGDCHKCSGCGAVEQNMLLTVANPIGAQPGQVVTIRTESGPVLQAAAVLYLLPLVLFFIGYAVWNVLGSGLAFVLGVAIAWVYDRKVVRKQKTQYTITGFGYMPHQPEEGDNHLD